MDLWRDYMLEHETQTIIHTLTERAIGSSQSLALKDALAADLPKSVKLYMQCEVVRWLQSDLKNASHFSNVQFATPLVRQLTKLYTRTVAPEYILTREEFTSTLENAVHFVENYLCRPRWTLAQFVFDKSERVHLAEVQAKFEYLSDYLYYGKLVHGYLQKKELQEISIEDFRSLLARIDDQVVKQHNPRELAQLTRPIFEFLLLQQDMSDKPIPIKPLTVFFEDKHMIEVKEYIERICRVRRKEQLTIAQLADIIDDLYSKGGAYVRPPQKTPRIPEYQREDLPQSSLSASEQSQAPIIENQEETRLSSTDQQERETSPPASPKEELPKPGAATDRRNIALSLTFSGMTETAKPAAVHSSPLDLKTMIDDSQRERFIRTIFQKDEAYYNVVVDALNGMPTWKDASLYLKMFYQTTGVDPYVQDVVEFSDLIQQRYSYPEHP